jgi:hypothetical protein
MPSLGKLWSRLFPWRRRQAELLESMDKQLKAIVRLLDLKF